MKRPRWSRILAWIIALPVVLTGVVLGAAWWWAGTGDSLAAVLERAARYLPEGQVLEASDVTGSLRNGGHIGLLRWQNKGMVITARQIDVGWDIEVFLRSKLHLSGLHVRELDIEDKDSAAEPFTPPQSVVLPIVVDIPFVVDALRWAGPPELRTNALSGRYRYDGTRHALTIDGVRIAQGNYQGSGTLLATAPLTLDATVKGQIRATLPGSAQELPLSAEVTIQGPIAGKEAVLDVRARLEPTTGTDKSTPAVKSMRAQGTGRIQPWAVQPVLDADVRFEGINLASLWPDLPQTLLSGALELRPQGQGWQAQTRVANGASGPWDRHRIPLDEAQARLRYVDGGWLVDSLVGRAGPGELRGNGRWHAGAKAGAAWQASIDLRNIDPARFHTRFAPAVLDGRATATSTGGAIDFDVALQPATQQGPRSPLQGLRLREVLAKGRWAAPLLNLSAFKLRTDDALLQGRLEVQTSSRAGRGDIHLDLPGGNAELHGQLGSTQGEGEFALELADAGKATRWLAQWPGMPTMLTTTSVQGQATLKGRWQGGWNAMQSAAAPGPSTAGGNGLTLNASLSAPRLDILGAQKAPVEALRLSDLRAELRGPLSALDLQLSGELASGTRRVSARTQATGGRGAGGEWQGRIASLALRLQDSSRPGPWNAQLRQAVSLSFRSEGVRTRLEAGSGELLLTGPVPGTARIGWEPLLWQQTSGSYELRSVGRIQDLPMGWIDTLASANGSQLANLQLTGNLVFDGTWNLVAAQTLKLQASLERKSGDLGILSEENSAGRIEAGVHQARVTLDAEGDSVRASLRWDSERAGQVQADFNTRVSRSSKGWEWPDDAPVAGKLEARLPRVGAWSMLAPPGWRMRGTLEASAKLGGTRQAPQWDGLVHADDLVLRSVVEGIELRDGQLRAVLRGQRLELTEFVLRGAPVAGGAPTSGGVLTATGFAQWIPGSGLRSDVQAQARGLRASLRADRRLVVSGQVRAQTEGPKLTVRGTLKADQALFVLPDENTPSLGPDVVVQSAATRAASAQNAAAAAGAPGPSSGRTADAVVTFDMGDDFRVQGRGLSTRLTGSLELSTGGRAGAAPRVTGVLRTALGSYRAYGQALDIEQGVLRFSGPYDNPALDVLAIRPNLTQRVGVQITGTALSPRIRLYAEPELPDAEKLAWLVLGRSAANGGAESAVLQQAALALLGGNGRGLSGGLAQALGLDELSFSGATSNSAGTTTSATVTVGKRLARNFYVAYERSLAGTLGTFYIFYDLSRRFTLRAQTGEQSAVDLIFTLPFD